MVIQKRAQFFLLAAVIISAVIISLGFVANKATVNREPGNFADFSYEVKRETGAVIDYEIYKITEGELDEFVDLYAVDIRDRDPDSNFIFIYGNGTEMVIKNYGSESVYTDDREVEGSGAILVSSIGQHGIYTSSIGELGDHDPDSGTETLDVTGQDEIIVTINDNDYSFPVSPYKQVIFIIQKETEDENFISIK